MAERGVAATKKPVEEKEEKAEKKEEVEKKEKAEDGLRILLINCATWKGTGLAQNTSHLSNLKKVLASTHDMGLDVFAFASTGLPPQPYTIWTQAMSGQIRLNDLINLASYGSIGKRQYEVDDDDAWIAFADFRFADEVDSLTSTMASISLSTKSPSSQAFKGKGHGAAILLRRAPHLRAYALPGWPSAEVETKKPSPKSGPETTPSEEDVGDHLRELLQTLKKETPYFITACDVDWCLKKKETRKVRLICVYRAIPGDLQGKTKEIRRKDNHLTTALQLLCHRLSADRVPIILGDLNEPDFNRDPWSDFLTGGAGRFCVPEQHPTHGNKILDIVIGDKTHKQRFHPLTPPNARFNPAMESNVTVIKSPAENNHHTHAALFRFT